MKTFIVDSFTDVPFKGNPAGVCLVDSPLEGNQMLAIAKELNLSETAFVQRSCDGSEESAPFAIRYFSPKMEIPLCGHATLASAKVLHDETGKQKIMFTTAEGLNLKTSVTGAVVSMEFPVYETTPSSAPPSLLAALGIDRVNNAVYNGETKILLLEIDSTDQLARLSPDFQALVTSLKSINGVLVTARDQTDQFDFHSRYFWPWSGTNEDPVTGGSHTFLAPYWASRLGKNKLRSFQSSERTGFMDLELKGSSLTIQGSAVVVFKGELCI